MIIPLASGLVKRRRCLSQLSRKGFFQHRRQQGVQLRRCLRLQLTQGIDLGLQLIEVSDNVALFGE